MMIVMYKNVKLNKMLHICIKKPQVQLI